MYCIMSLLSSCICQLPSSLQMVSTSVLWCCWLGLLTCKTNYRVGEPTAAWQFVDIRQHRSFDNGWQYVSCGQRQPPLSGASVNKWLSTTTRERRIPPDSESGGIPHLFGTSLSPHIGSAWRDRHNNNKKKMEWIRSLSHYTARLVCCSMIRK